MADYISREQAIKAISEDIMGGLNYERILRELPTADVRENVHGEWKRTVTGHPYCSSCNWFPEENEMTGFFYDFCPNCGSYNGGKKDVDE